MPCVTLKKTNEEQPYTISALQLVWAGHMPYNGSGRASALYGVFSCHLASAEVV